MQIFADRTEGYSGSDLSNVILTGLFEPIRDVQTATHWMKGIGESFISFSKKGSVIFNKYSK